MELRSRKIRAEFFRDDRIAEVTPASRLMLITLWGLADKRGSVLVADALDSHTLPFLAGVDVISALTELVAHDHIAKSESVIQVLRWDYWQPGVHRDDERVRSDTRRWRKANPSKVSAMSARNRAAKLYRTPQWADKKKIQEFYDKARCLTEATGIPHEVDHIIPLNGKTVSGMHVHNNLQILTATDNRKKSNKSGVVYG